MGNLVYETLIEWRVRVQKRPAYGDKTLASSRLPEVQRTDEDPMVPAGMLRCASRWSNCNPKIHRRLRWCSWSRPMLRPSPLIKCLAPHHGHTTAMLSASRTRAMSFILPPQRGHVSTSRLRPRCISRRHGMYLHRWVGGGAGVSLWGGSEWHAGASAFAASSFGGGRSPRTRSA